MLLAQGIDRGNGLPYVDQLVNGVAHRRYLTALPTPASHKVMALAPWSQATGIAPIPRADWPKRAFQRIHTEVPILDQDGQGACVAYAATAAAMLLRVRGGETYTPLSPNFLYTLINGGRDAGANGGDAADTLVSTGVCTAASIVGRPLRPAGVNSAAMAEAARFKLGAVAPISSIAEAVTAVVMGWQLIFDVEAGGAYTTDSGGVIRYLGSRTNHEQTAGEGLKMLPDGQVAFLNRNSWNTVWGGGGGLPGGFGWIQEKHIGASNTTLALQWMIGDPQDPLEPPSL